MSAHGRPRGRARPRTRGAPPHVSEARHRRITNRRTTDDRERLKRIHGREEQRVLFETTVGGQIRDAYAGLICCYCEREVEDGRFVRTKDGTGRLCCLRRECRARDERRRQEAA